MNCCCWQITLSVLSRFGGFIISRNDNVIHVRKSSHVLKCGHKKVVTSRTICSQSRLLPLIWSYDLLHFLIPSDCVFCSGSLWRCRTPSLWQSTLLFFLFLLLIGAALWVSAEPRASVSVVFMWVCQSRCSRGPDGRSDELPGRAPRSRGAALHAAHLLRQVRGAARKTQQHRPDLGRRPGRPAGGHGELLLPAEKQTSSQRRSQTGHFTARRWPFWVVFYLTLF